VLGVAVGVGALVGVVGVSSSVQAGLVAKLTGLGDILTVQVSGAPGQTSLIPESVLPEILRIPTVEAVAATRTLSASVTRTAAVPSDQAGGIGLAAFEGNLAGAIGAQMDVTTRALASSSSLPEGIAGWEAAQALGITPPLLPMSVYVGEQSILVVGILDPTPVESTADDSVFVPAVFARSDLGFDGTFDTVYVRVPIAFSETVSGLLIPTISPEGTLQLQVSEDSSALIAAGDAETAYQGLFLALAGVCLIVAGFGVGNILTIAVVERRGEIGIRRALGATRTSIAMMFLTEGLIVALLGGAVGIVFGVWATVVAAWHQSIRPDLPLGAALIGLGAALAVALFASVYPAMRAAAVPPSDALRTMA
jgi:putative ABC transport system permease protein